MQAVILAAGLGSRIREFHDLPKGFIRFGDQFIVEESIEKLNACGIHDILIVTGYADHFYSELSKKRKNISTLFNPFYEKYSSLYSLYCAKEWVKEDFLVLESDIIYEKKAISALLHYGYPNSVLLSGDTHSTDEVYVQSRDQKLVRMSKEKNHLELDEIAGEFVGINKLSLRDFRQLVHQLEQNSALLHTGHYEEHGLVAMTGFTDVYCVKEADLLWSEIDNRFQYERAKQIYEKIHAQEIEV